MYGFAFAFNMNLLLNHFKLSHKHTIYLLSLMNYRSNWFGKCGIALYTIDFHLVSLAATALVQKPICFAA